MNTLHEYINGNYKVILYDDGTKERINNELFFTPSFPESIDVKITNSCNLNCKYCHEKSFEGGDHCDIDVFINKLKGLPAGVELAIGGGNPLDHPKLFSLLVKLKNLKFISNMTINSKHLELNKKYRFLLFDIIESKLIHGLGVSYNENINIINWLNSVSYSMRKNVVVHLIAGVHSFKQIREMVSMVDKVLILGYKNYGRGITYLSDDVKNNITNLKNNLWSLWGKNTLSFDNLAIEQLELHKHFSLEKWSEVYMGDDGNFTMYYDAVNNQFAKSSISKRVDAKNLSIIDFFQVLNGI